MSDRIRNWKEFLSHERTIATFVVIVLPVMIALTLGAYAVLGPRIWTHSQLDDWCEQTTGRILRSKYGKAENWTPFLGGGLGDQMRSVGSWNIPGQGQWTAACHSMPGGLKRDASYQIGKN